MGCFDQVKGKLSEAVFTPSNLLTKRGGLHIAQIIVSFLTFLLGCFRGGSEHTYWNYAMFSWAFCPIMTLIITVIEMFLIHILLKACLDWDDFTTGMAMTSSLMTISSAITYAYFYARFSIYGSIVSLFAFLCGILYLLEVVKDKCLDKKMGVYLAALPGFWKVLEAFVSCMLFVSVTGHRNSAALTFCVLAYIIPFPILLLIIPVNILKKLKTCLPFNLDRVVFIFLVISVVLYIIAAIVWPLYAFRNNPRPGDCLLNFCIWDIQFMVVFFTYVNLILFTLDLIFTLLGICNFKRS